MKKWFGCLLLVILCGFMAACGRGSGEEEQQNMIQVYYLNREETAIVPVEYVLVAKEQRAAVEEVLDVMRAEPEENELKVKAMLCHKSQIEWLGEHDGDNPVEAMQAQSMAYGKSCGVLHAEAFIKCSHDCRLACKHLLP